MLACTATAPFAYARKDSVPDWVRDAAKETLPDYHHEPNAVVLLDDQEYTVLPNGHTVLHERIVRRILRPEGRSEANFSVWYNKDSKVNWMHIWSIGPDGHEYAVKDNEQVDVAAVSYALYEDDRGRIGHAPAGDPGAIVAMEYEEQEPFYIPEVRWELNSEIPIHRNRLSVQFPPGFTFDTRWKQHGPITPVQVGNNRWQWEQLDVPALNMKEIRLAPAPGELLAMMTLHYAAAGATIMEDWKSLGVWYQRLTADRIAATPEMVAKAQALTAGITDFYERAKAIDNFVRGDIRYVAVEVGIGGYQPHAAADIFRNRYGDCKDKATLLAAMLAAAGIHSTWLWVDTEHSMDASMPSLLGDHMVAAIELPAGYTSPEMYSVVTAKSGKRFLITDPTWEKKTPFGQIEHELQGTSALLVDGEQSQVIQIPVMDPGRNTWTRTAHLKLELDGGLKGDVTERMYGDEGSEFRYAFTYSDEHQRSEILDRHVNADLTGFTLENVKIDNLPDVDKEAVLSYSVTAKSYAKTMGPLLMVRPRVLGSDALRLDDKQRHYAINLGQTVRKQDSFDVELPEGYVVDELPAPVKKDVGFASYESSTSVKGKTLHYERTYTVRQVEVPAERYGDLRGLVSAIVNDERSNAILRKAQ
jgi:transglutaminase-like putative cysteine protease